MCKELSKIIKERLDRVVFTIIHTLTALTISMLYLTGDFTFSKIVVLNVFTMALIIFPLLLINIVIGLIHYFKRRNKCLSS